MADPNLKVKGVGVLVGVVFFACSVDLSSFRDFFFLLPYIKGAGLPCPSSRSATGMEKHTF